MIIVKGGGSGGLQACQPHLNPHQDDGANPLPFRGWNGLTGASCSFQQSHISHVLWHVSRSEGSNPSLLFSTSETAAGARCPAGGIPSQMLRYRGESSDGLLLAGVVETESGSGVTGVAHEKQHMLWRGNFRWVLGNILAVAGLYAHCVSWLLAILLHLVLLVRASCWVRNASLFVWILLDILHTQIYLCISDFTFVTFSVRLN